MVRAVAGRAVSMAVDPVLAGQHPVECIEQIVVRARPDLDDDEPGRGMGHEEREQAVLGGDVGEERGTGGGQVRQAARRSRADRELARLYGKMLRRASRRRPSPPIAGADS